jgi:hypothetical protein
MGTSSRGVGTSRYVASRRTVIAPRGPKVPSLARVWRPGFRPQERVAAVSVAAERASRAGVDALDRGGALLN